MCWREAQDSKPSRVARRTEHHGDESAARSGIVRVSHVDHPPGTSPVAQPRKAITPRRRPASP
jgi:hypothetical protein